MSFHFDNGTPIYLQIIESIKQDVICEKYLPNQKLPSVRELALAFSVNPNTIQKALAELEEIGLIFTERTNGKFVTGDKTVIEKIKRETVQKMVENFYNSMEKIGLNREEIFEILSKEK